MSTNTSTSRRLPVARIVIGAIVIASGLLVSLVASGFDRKTVHAPTQPATVVIDGNMGWIVPDDLTPQRMVVATDVLPTADDESRVQIIQTGDGTLDLSVDPGGIHTHVITDSSRSTIYAIGNDLLAIDAVSGTELWRVPAPARRVVWIGGLGISTLALSNNGRWLFVANQEPNSPSDIPFWVDVVDATTGAMLASSEVIPNCGAARLLPRPEPTNLLIVCLGPEEVHLLTLEPDSTDTQMRTTLTVIAETRNIPGRVVDAALTGNGEQVVLVSETGHMAMLDWTSELTGNPLQLFSDDAEPLLSADEQQQWRVSSFAFSATTRQLFLALTPIFYAPTGMQRVDEDRSYEVRVYDGAFEEVSRTQLPNYPVAIPLVMGAYGDTVFVVDNTAVEGQDDPGETRVLEVIPAENRVEVLVALEGQYITHVQPLANPPQQTRDVPVITVP